MVKLFARAPYNIYNKPIDKNVASFFSDINTLDSKVKDGRTETPFGPFITPGFKEGSNVEIIRPQHLKIDFDRNGKVLALQFKMVFHQR